MTKQDLVERVYKDTKFRKIPKVAIEEMIVTAFGLFSQSICQTGKFTYPGFGSFVLRKRNPRKARNPQSGETVFVESRKTVLFRVSPEFKEKLR